jgi:hypothetical protein
MPTQISLGTEEPVGVRPPAPSEAIDYARQGQVAALSLPSKDAVPASLTE